MIRQFLVLIATASIALATSAHASTSFVLVRHTEKLPAENGTAQTLSDAGKQRAQDLARLLHDVPLTAVYASTDPTPEGSIAYITTWDTARPAAQDHSLNIQGYAAKDIDTLLNHAWKYHRNETVLIVGHSNTIPEMIEALGVRTPVNLTTDDYDDIFIVTVDDQGDATLLHLHYGQPSK
jgi:broad specificity phosphatase PhoE